MYNGLVPTFFAEARVDKQMKAQKCEEENRLIVIFRSEFLSKVGGVSSDEKKKDEEDRQANACTATDR